MLPAELRKLLALPGSWAGIAVTIAGTAGVAALNANSALHALQAGTPEQYPTASVFAAAYAGAPLGTVGAVVIGALAIGSEYTVNSTDAGGGRQISATLTAMPRRLPLVLAKTAAVLLTTILTGAIALAASLGTAFAIIGDALPGFDDDTAPGLVGALLYWTLMALIALGITMLARSTVIPLLVLIVNSSVVSVSLLLSRLTPLAYGLPDMAGYRLFAGLWSDADMGGLDPVPGALVMAAWAVALVLTGGIAFSRRDA